MFIVDDKEGNLRLHFGPEDLQECVVIGSQPTRAGSVGGQPLLVLTKEKAYELECKIEEKLKPAQVPA